MHGGGEHEEASAQLVCSLIHEFWIENTTGTVYPVVAGCHIHPTGILGHRFEVKSHLLSENLLQAADTGRKLPRCIFQSIHMKLSGRDAVAFQHAVCNQRGDRTLLIGLEDKAINKTC